jgi:hypothetical protein
MGAESACVDTRVSGMRVFITFGGDVTIDQRHRHHVLQAMVAGGEVRQRTLDADHADGV